MQPSNREVAVARLCAHGRSLGCTRSDQRHGRLRAAHISLRRSGSSTAVIVTERPFVQRRRCPGLTLLGPGNLESRCSTFGQPPLRGRDRRPSSSSTSSARARADRRIIAAENGAMPSRYAHQRERLKRVPRPCRGDRGEVPGA